MYQVPNSVKSSRATVGPFLADAGAASARMITLCTFCVTQVSHRQGLWQVVLLGNNSCFHYISAQNIIKILGILKNTVNVTDDNCFY